MSNNHYIRPWDVRPRSEYFNRSYDSQYERIRRELENEGDEVRNSARTRPIRRSNNRTNSRNTIREFNPSIRLGLSSNAVNLFDLPRSQWGLAEEVPPTNQRQRGRARMRFPFESLSGNRSTNRTLGSNNRSRSSPTQPVTQRVSLLSGSTVINSSSSRFSSITPTASARTSSSNRSSGSYRSFYRNRGRLG